MRKIAAPTLLVIVLGIGLHTLAADEPEKVKIASLEGWLKAMKSPNYKTRLEAIEQIIEVYEHEYIKNVVPVLLRALRGDTSSSVRGMAAYHLRPFSVEPGVIPALIEALKDRALSEMGESRDVCVGGWAARSLAVVRDDHFILLQFNYHYSLKSLDELRLIVDKELKAAVAPLMEYAKKGDADPLMSGWAIEALAKISRREKKVAEGFVPILIKFLKDKTSSIKLRNQVVEAIGTSGPQAEAALPIMRETLRAPIPPGVEERSHYYLLLGSIGKLQRKATPAVPELLAILRDKRQPPEFRWAVASSLGGIGDTSDPVLQALTAVADENTEEVSMAAVEALKMLHRHRGR